MTGLELVIVVVILGITMMMTLRGAQLVTAVRAFLTGYQLEQLQNRFFVYENTYGSLPGDDPTAAARYGLPQPIARVGGSDISFLGNGRIDGYLSDPLSPNGEPYMAWRHLRAARLIEGSAEVSGAAASPENPFSGFYGIDEGNLGMKKASLCATRIPGSAARAIDRRLDDGAPDKGTVLSTSRFDPVQANNHFDAPDSGPYDPAKEYIVCIPLQP